MQDWIELQVGVLFVTLLCQNWCDQQSMNAVANCHSEVTSSIGAQLVCFHFAKCAKHLDWPEIKGTCFAITRHVASSAAPAGSAGAASRPE